MQNYSETDLYYPIHDYLTKQGFEIKAEVKNCDIVAKKDNQVIIIEIKKVFNLKLVYQALDRLKYSNIVFVAVLKPKKHDKNALMLLKKLNIGYIIVDPNVNNICIMYEPVTEQKIKNKKVLKEFDNRIFNKNIGGTCKQKILTAYKEQCLKVAYLLYMYGNMSAKDLKANFDCGANTYSILSKNHYNWFEKTSHGVYNISVDGINALNDKMFEDYICYFKKTIQKERSMPKP